MSINIGAKLFHERIYFYFVTLKLKLLSLFSLLNSYQLIFTLLTFLLQKIKKIYDKNVYNLISVSTGSILTMELARQLQLQKPKAQLQLFFIDNDPQSIETSIQQLGKARDLEINLLRNTFSIHDLKVINMNFVNNNK